MSVKVRPYGRGWEVDIRVVLANRQRFRERTRVTVLSKSAAIRWGEAREGVLIREGPRQVKKEVPTVSAFAPRFLDGHARANQQKPAGIAHKETVLRIHLVPRLGTKRLDAIRTEDVQQLKQHLA